MSEPAGGSHSLPLPERVRHTANGYTIRRAEEKDSAAILALRNDDSARAQFFDNSPVPKTSHGVWFPTFIQRPDTLFIVLELNDGRIAGYCRFESKNGVSEVSVAVAHDQRSKGYGSILISEGCTAWTRKFPCIKLVIAFVQQGNLASEKAFSKCGFKSHGLVEHNGHEVEKLALETGSLSLSM